MASNTAPDTRRAIVQRLESLRRAGLTHLPLTAREDVAVDIAADLSSPDSVASEAAPIPSSADLSSPPQGQLSVTDDMPVTRPQSGPPSTLSVEERTQKLCDAAATVAACMQCQELAETRTQTVFGVGAPDAKILFVGEAPGADEDKQGEPFVGQAGQLLDKIITACGLKREEIYICNILKCRPPGNRNPSPEEAGHCREYLDAQIATIDPDYIVCWGSVAAKNLLDTKEPIGRMRGEFRSYGRAKVLCTYHPSYLLRNPPAKKDVWDDMKFLFRDMGITLDS
jgi:DNA polymerase